MTSSRDGLGSDHYITLSRNNGSATTRHVATVSHTLNSVNRYTLDPVTFLAVDTYECPFKTYAKNLNQLFAIKILSKNIKSAFID